MDDNINSAEPDEEDLIFDGELPTEHNTKHIYSEEDNRSCASLSEFFANAWIH